LFFTRNFDIIIDVPVGWVSVMTASGTLLVKNRSSTLNNIKTTSHQLLKRQRRQANLLARKKITFFVDEKKQQFRSLRHWKNNKSRVY